MAGIEEARRNAGILQSELAKELGVSQSTVSMWETGASMPRVDKLKKMAQLFGCTVDELLS